MIDAPPARNLIAAAVGRRMPVSDVDHARLQFARLIRIDPDGMVARIKLKPGIRVPADLLHREMANAGVVFGIDEAAVAAAAIPDDERRLIQVAAGQRPGVGRAGRDVYGNEVAAVPATAVPDHLRISVREDGMEAVAHWPAGVPVPLEELRRALMEARVSHGYRREALTALLDGTHQSEGVVVAAGRSPRSGRRDGFYLIEAAGSRLPVSLERVEPGQILASWQEGHAGNDGLDVHGRQLAAPENDSADAELVAGSGTEMRLRDQRPHQLVAARSGTVYQRPDGTVVVAEAQIIDHSLGRSDRLRTNQVVVVNGDIEQGARVACTADVLVTGDIYDGKVQVAGNLMVGGAVRPGSNYVAVANTLRCRSVAQRVIMAGSAMVEGLAFACVITTTEDLIVHHAIGGRLVAGSRLHLKHAGDSYGNVTQLWAGHDLKTPRLVHLRNLQLAGRIREREMALEDLGQVQGRIADIRRSMERIQQGAYVNDRELAQITDRLTTLSQGSDRLDALIEGMRDEIQRSRHAANHGPDPFNLEHNVEVAIRGAARRNTTTKVADDDTWRFERTQYHVVRGPGGSGERGGV
jgi:hypothetical protein